MNFATVIVVMALVLAAVFTAVYYTMSLAAAAVMTLVLGVLFIAVVALMYARAYREGAKLTRSLASAMFGQWSLQPRRLRPRRNQEVTERLAVELADLGFAPAGFYNVTDMDFFLEGLAHPEAGVYATIYAGDHSLAPWIDLTTPYEDGGFFCVTSGHVPPGKEKNQGSVTLQASGRGPEELMLMMMDKRPTASRLEVTVKGYKTYVEDFARRQRDGLWMAAQVEDAQGRAD